MPAARNPTRGTEQPVERAAWAMQYSSRSDVIVERYEKFTGMKAERVSSIPQ